MQRSILLILIFLSTQLSWAQIRQITYEQKQLCIELEQWEVIDVVFKTKKTVKMPFEAKLFATISHDDREQRVPLFYNGQKEWVLRFSSATTGIKNFTLESDIKFLSGLKGQFNVHKNTKTNRHGGIVLNESNPQHFFYEDGSHYFNLAFECDWLFALDYGNEDIAKSRHLLSLIEENGFNQVVMNVYSYDVSWPKDTLLAKHPEHEYGGREDIYPFPGSNSNPDFSSLNIDFFKHFDKVIAEMHEKEIVSHLMIYVWNKLVNWPDMESEADNRYYDYVIKRYQAFPNIIWDVSKEALHYTRATKEYISERIERTRQLDSYNRLVSVHDYGFCVNHRDEVDFISMQNWQHTLYQIMLNARQKFPDKPIFNIEHGGYEESPYVVFPGAYDNAEACLRRNYMCAFSGGYSTYYWQGASWNVIIHNPFEQDLDFKKPHFEYYRHMHHFFDSVHFENCVPLKHFNSSGYNLTNEEDGIVLMYVPKENNWISASKVIKDKLDFSNATEQWFNTLTGEYSPEIPYQNNSIVSEMWDGRPWKNEADAILIIKGLEKKKQ